MINLEIKKNKGFTLVETMFAVYILTFTIVGLMTIVANSLFSARYARDEITVNYLLQEVIDYVRNDRDTTVFLAAGASPAIWTTFLNKYDNCSSANGCYFNINMLNPVIKKCPSEFCPNLYYDEEAVSDSFYNYDDSKLKTNFKRKIVIESNASNSDEIDVTVTIDWKNGSKAVKRSLSTSLMNWQK